ncbi:ABC transporter ATP-binding protein [bacterium]|nr:ABC transporter ATP-binding protein [bacterium]
MPKTEPVVVARGLSRAFGAFKAVDSIDFTVCRGEIFGFLGANGAGKTTTIRILCGLLSPTGGSCTVGGIDVGRDPEGVKQRIGYMSQKFSLYEDLTVAENLEFFGGVYGLDNSRLRQRRDEILGRLHLSDMRDRRTAQLPLGWKQRLALASAVIHEPGIVFLDEPTGGVDPISRRNFWAMIHEMAAGGVTVFVTTHYMDEAEYCDRISIMDSGRIIALGSPAELKQQYGKESVDEVFLHLLAR